MRPDSGNGSRRHGLTARLTVLAREESNVSNIPDHAKVVLALPNCDAHELSEDESRQVLDRYPELLSQYRKFAGMTQTRGRLIVIDQALVAEIVAWLRPGEWTGRSDRDCPGNRSGA